VTFDCYGDDIAPVSALGLRTIWIDGLDALVPA